MAETLRMAVGADACIGPRADMESAPTHACKAQRCPAIFFGCNLPPNAV